MKVSRIIFVLLISALAISAIEKREMQIYPRSYDWRKPESRFASAPDDQKILRDDSNSRAGNCPIAEDIAPCVCTNDTYLVLDCSAVQTEAQLEEVFQAEFPVKEFYTFVIDSSYNLFRLDFSTNGVSFVEFLFTGSQSSIEFISEEFFRDSAATVSDIDVFSSEIGDGGFPFEALSGYPSLSIVRVTNARLTQMPIIESDSLGNLALRGNEIAAIEPGTLAGVPNLYQLIMEFNQLTELKTGSVPFSNTVVNYDFISNQIQSIEAGAFYDVTTNGNGSIIQLLFNDNLLTELVSGSIPITYQTVVIDLDFNHISTIASDAFYVLTEPGLDSFGLYLRSNALTTVDEAVFGPLLPFFRPLSLYLEDNPLECGCDIAWLVASPDFGKLSPLTSCSDGTLVTELDPEVFANC